MPASIFDAGAVLIPNFVSEAEETRLLQRIDEAEWISDLSRRVQHYGYRYDYRARGADPHVPAAAFPRWATVMADRMAAWFDDQERSSHPRFPPPVMPDRTAAWLNAYRPEQCIVNEYHPGQGIGMHADHESFGPVVASLSLGADWDMRFRPRSVRPYVPGARPGDETVTLFRRTLLVLRREARTKWMHGIASTDTRTYRRRRVSATFRTLARV